MSRKRSGGIFAFAGGIMLNQALAVIFSLLVTSMFGVLFKNSAMLPTSIVCMAFFLFMGYYEGWCRGSRDANAAKLGRIKLNRLRGVFAGLLEAVPGVILAVITIAVETSGLKTVEFLQQDVSVYIYRIWYIPFQFLFELFDKAPAWAFLPPLILPFASGLGYVLGLHQYSLLKVFYFARENKKD